MRFEWDERKNKLDIPNMNKPSETNWAQIDALTDETIDTSDMSPLTQSFVARVTLRMPKRPVPVTVRIDPDVLAWFRA